MDIVYSIKEKLPKIVKDMKNNHGLIREEDLAYIPEPLLRKPIRRKYRHVSVVTLPPPAAGGTLLLTLMMLNHLPPSFYEVQNLVHIILLQRLFEKHFSIEFKDHLIVTLMIKLKKNTSSKKFCKTNGNINS